MRVIIDITKVILNDIVWMIWGQLRNLLLVNCKLVPAVSVKFYILPCNILLLLTTTELNAAHLTSCRLGVGQGSD